MHTGTSIRRYFQFPGCAGRNAFPHMHTFICIPARTAWERGNILPMNSQGIYKVSGRRRPIQRRQPILPYRGAVPIPQARAGMHTGTSDYRNPLYMQPLLCIPARTARAGTRELRFFFRFTSAVQRETREKTSPGGDRYQTQSGSTPDPVGIGVRPNRGRQPTPTESDADHG
uniref:Uncharacterized protein n=1 Tax=Candidatus Kentrum sp. MB TaxID=2138164 RepID=A0A450XVM3_9GAMM|nr:MAG: hypothetical protein BECKMB1821I_GA0114274_104413 [Candidatus Kentron sp. MB]VFK76131.1 MAG: hypothetical protein BECKMB1821H_GA0114242_104311 [Candidatus Kentron sp. MB]